MSKLMWMVCFGLCCWIGVSQAQYDISCRFKGVFHVEKGPRYNQTAEEARKTCAELDAVIATEEQMEIAMESGFEICRYGWIENNTLAIPRITPNKKCANNFVGLYVQHPNLTSMWDVFCYNASDQTERNCEKYDFKNESFVSRDPTLEGDYTDSESSKVSPTHPGLDVGPSYNDQWTASEDVTTEPGMSTEQSEHSGDHSVLPEDGDIKNNENGEDCCATDGDDLIAVGSGEKYKNREEGSSPGTDPSSHRNTGSNNEFPDAHDGHHSDDNAESVDPPIEDLATGDKSGSKQNRQKRMAAIPDWLIVCVSLVCLGLIFSVCIALNARRICGQKKKLVINGNNKGCPEDGVIMEQNGDTIKSQEMVQLVSKEQTNELGDQDEPLNQENMRNTKDVDMKIGV
ncbi:CD44 antigen isoform X1 [Rana temporaria]|uniref:CD44 antigen isoform X1 n=1 Tax=Rana temporaria TaxID=8407 RepID=UPI001AADAB9D|nr:CD44 antigen isoform X1 [Rana temporaria]